MNQPYSKEEISIGHIDIKQEGISPNDSVGDHLVSVTSQYSKEITQDINTGVYPVQIVANLTTTTGSLAQQSLIHDSDIQKDTNPNSLWINNNLPQSSYKTTSSRNLSAGNAQSTITSSIANISENTSSFFLSNEQSFSSDRISRSFINPKGLRVVKKYKCPLCVYRTSYKSDLNRHSKKHGKCPFTCDICKMPFMSMGIVMYHKRKHHSEQVSSHRHKYPCSICPYGTKYKSDLNRHLRLHTLAKYLCDTCRLPFNNLETLQIHSKTWHSDSNALGGIILNKTVGMETATNSDGTATNTTTAQTLNVHPCLNEVGTSNNQLEAISELPSDNVCLYLQNVDKHSSDGVQSSSLLSNSSGIESNITSQSSKYKCTFCEKIFRSQSSLDFHIRQSHLQTSLSLAGCDRLNLEANLNRSAREIGTRWCDTDGNDDTHSILQCLSCVFKTYSQFAFDNHTAKHRTARYSCPVCHIPFRKLVNLSQHKRQHHQRYHHQNTEDMEQPIEYRYYCAMCCYKTDHKSTFNRHTLRHGICKYQCDECQMPFIKEGNLILHKKLKHAALDSISIYDNEFRFQCPHCQYASSYKSTIDRHVKKHSVAHYKCDICNMPFIFRGNVFHHKKLRHPEVAPNIVHRNYSQQQCHLCDYSTQYQLELEKHLRSCHNDTEYQCGLCDLSFISSDALFKHTQCKHQTYATGSYPLEPMVIDCQDNGTDAFFCTYCPTQMTNRDDYIKHVSSHKVSGYFCTICNSSFMHHLDFEQHMLQHYNLSDLAEDTNLHKDSRPVTSAMITGELLNSDQTYNNSEDLLILQNNFQAENSQSKAFDEIQNFIEIDDDDDDDNYDDKEAEVEKTDYDNGENQKCSQLVRSEIDSVSKRNTSNTTSTVEYCDREIQCDLIGATSEANTSANQSSSSPSFVQPPRKGRYVKLVSDFDDYAERPYACALCYHRYGQFEELAVHVQNHLTGAGRCEEIPPTAHFSSTVSIKTQSPEIV